MIRVYHLLIFGFFLPAFNLAQADSSTSMAESDNGLTLEGYAEAYHAYDFGNPFNGIRPGILYNHTLHNQPAFNLLFLKMAYEQSMFRANLALMEGTYRQFNLAQEPPYISNLFEANIGFRLSKQQNLWLDAGIFPSHIGFESAVGAECLTLTRSIVAENSPYYESGIKLTYETTSNHFKCSALLLSGWQRVLPVRNNSLPGLGWQFSYRIKKHLLLNYSGLFVNLNTDAFPYWRHYHNLYAVLEADRLNCIAGLDIGFQNNVSNIKDDMKKGSWFTPVLILSYRFSKHIQAAMRGEYFKDAKGFIAHPFSDEGLNLIGASLNTDFRINEFLLFRAEGRLLRDRNKVFTTNGLPDNQNLLYCMAVIFKF
jgi:hypothetical protein